MTTPPGDRRSTRSKLALLLTVPLLLGAALVMLVASPASAHRGEQSYLYLDVAETELAGRVEFPYTDVREVFGLDLEGDPEAIQSELEANLSPLIDYIRSTTAIGADDLAWTLSFDGVELLSDREDTEGEPGYAIFPFTAELPADEVPRELDIAFSPFFTELDNRDSIVLVANDWQRGVFDAEANELLFLNPGQPAGTLDLGNPSQWLNFTGSVDLGVNHIRTGPDHILFVLVLLLPSVLVFSAAAWRPAADFGASLWRVLKVVTMFTVAHSITFSLAGLELIPLPPSSLVETIIAVSIAVAAIHNLRPVVQNREWALAFAFGLFHGLGFASLVDALDTSRTAQLVSLLGRNLGIEIGQAIAILIAFPALFLLRRTRYYQPLFTVGSIGLAVIALVWAAERIGGFDLGTTDLALLFLKWPRILWVMIVATIGTAVLYRFEDQAGRLLPVHGDGAASSDDPSSSEPASASSM